MLLTLWLALLTLLRLRLTLLALLLWLALALVARANGFPAQGALTVLLDDVEVGIIRPRRLLGESHGWHESQSEGCEGNGSAGDGHIGFPFLPLHGSQENISGLKQR